MAVNFNGGFKVGGIQHHHPLDTQELEFLLRILSATKFEGHMLDTLVRVTVKLQEEYYKVKELENIQK
jgi:hypothetical protein